MWDRKRAAALAMLSNANPVPKLYRSIIEDVIEGVRELFVDEGVEEQVLQELKQMWESKVMQSKAVEGFAKDAVNPSNFVLQLPASYAQNLQKPTASMVIPAGQSVQSFTTDMNSSGSAATLSLPPGMSYPVQIPAGVTLQTSSGHLYKVNVPVMVTRAPGGASILQQPVQRLIEQREAAVLGAGPRGPQVSGVSVPRGVLQPLTPQRKDLFQPGTAVGQLLQQQQLVLVPPRAPPVPQPVGQPSLQHTTLLGDGQVGAVAPEFGQPEPNQAPAAQSQTFPAQPPPGPPVTPTQTLGSDLVLGGLTPDLVAELASISPETPGPLGPDQTPDLDFGDLADIVQVDGACDSSSDEDGALREVAEADFLGIIDPEDLRVLEEGGGSSDSDGSSSASDTEPLLEEVEDDPLNSGDDVSEQDVPDLFDTDNVIVCQYDKIHRSKNRWKFYLKDGVMSFGGKDYAFSKAIGEAEW
ncbi:TFIIA-alpha and beta-like factor [Amia ocellicauda]|uniref:TFIIA-alpha and beta-like factor n=1 Tax=Amia ocellicauda TaxID=2972642 RepID=UPI003463C772